MNEDDRLNALSDALRRERRAIAALDAEALRLIAEEKERLLADFSGPPTAQSSRASWVQLLAEAEANRNLISDVRAALAGVLGVNDNQNVYDARARKKSALRSLTSKAV